MTGPLRVLLYAPHFAEYALRLAASLAERANVMLICERRNLAAEATPALLAQVRRRVTLATFDGSASVPAGPFARQVRLPWLVSRFRPDIAHVQEQADGPTAAMLTRLSRRVPVVLTVHDPRPHEGSDTAFAERGRHFRERLRANAAAYHVHGAFCERELRSTRRVDRPLISTAHGVLFVPDPDATRPRDPRGLLFFGRMEAYKGLETLLDAAALLRAQGVAFRLVVAGRGPELARLAPRLSAPDIELHESFLGPEEAIALFQRASLVLAPYREATQSGVIAAAFGNGRPVVVSSVGGLPEVVTPGRDGLVVPPDDPSALAAALAPLLTDESKIETLATGVAAKVRDELDWAKIAARLDSFYREVLDARSSRAPAGSRHPAEARP